ncbi:MAG: hypothetical protein WC765_00480 [Phycisphaerae bacterium]|jgi:hypothetical protein
MAKIKKHVKSIVKKKVTKKKSVSKPTPPDNVSACKKITIKPRDI